MNAIEDLQIRISYQEDHIQELNRTVARQQQQLDDLHQALQRLMQRLREVERNQPQEEPAQEPELPPHY